MNTPSIIEVPVEQESEKNGAFVAIVCRDVRPYLEYDRPLDCPKDQSFPHILMQLRWDGVFGFPGGKVDPGETLRQACVREAHEEIGLTLKESDLIPVCSHRKEGGNFTAHLYAVDVDAAMLHLAKIQALTAKDADAEVCGVVTLRVSNFGQSEGRGLLRFVKEAPMSFSARHELVMVLDRLRLLDVQDLQQLRDALKSG